jgi:hypothetical protein
MTLRREMGGQVGYYGSSMGSTSTGDISKRMSNKFKPTKKYPKKNFCSREELFRKKAAEIIAHCRTYLAFCGTNFLSLATVLSSPIIPAIFFLVWHLRILKDALRKQQVMSFKLLSLL